MKVRIFVEGGGNTKSDSHPLKLGFVEFFHAGLGDFKRPQIEMCGSRKEAYDDFCHALCDKYRKDDFNVLLVDSDEPVVATSSWKHLKSRDKWKNPGASDDQCHLMVQVMESWFYADPNALKEFYGKNFVTKHVPTRQDVENIRKNDVLKALKMATRNSEKGEYGKIKHASELLKKIDVKIIRSKAPHCETLFKVLENQLGRN